MMLFIYATTEILFYMANFPHWLGDQNSANERLPLCVS